jgi:hypothetical protein
MPKNKEIMSQNTPKKLKNSHICAIIPDIVLKKEAFPKF